MAVVMVWMLVLVGVFIGDIGVVVVVVIFVVVVMVGMFLLLLPLSLALWAVRKVRCVVVVCRVFLSRSATNRNA